MVGIDKEFDYLVPDGQPVPPVGTELRLNLSGRRVGGWVTEVGVDPEPELSLRPYAKVRGHGPEPEVIELAAWAAWRWAGRRASLLRSASADFAVPVLPPPSLRPPASPPAGDPATSLLDDWPTGEPCVLRLPPAADPTSVVASMAQRGPTLVIVPTASRAAVLAGRLRRAGGGVAVVPGEWAQARAGVAVVIGNRAAAWAPCPGLAGVVVLDGHDESLGQEQAPTWHAVEVAAERARRAETPCVIVTSCPSPELLQYGTPRTVDRSVERRGWATVEVVDRRGDDPRLGLYSSRLVNLVREPGRTLCVLNRTGRSRLLACVSCGELARCEICGQALRSAAEGADLQCPACGHERPCVCAVCNSTKMKVLRIGVSKAREDLEALSGRPVGEITGTSDTLADSEVVVGTEAALRRLSPASGLAVVAFVDFDQELLAPRFRAADEALGLLALASRLVRGRIGRILIQTRIPDHPVIRAALRAEPAVLSDHEIPIRRALNLPPFRHLALLSGPGAEAYVAALKAEPGARTEVLGPDGDSWMVKARSATDLADALAGVTRPPERVRVAVDPARG